MKPKFSHLNEELISLLKELGVTENDLFSHETDLYVGVPSREVGEKIKELKSGAQLFHPTKGSDMQEYPIGVDIPFALIDYKIMKKSPPPCTNFNKQQSQ